MDEGRRLLFLIAVVIGGVARPPPVNTEPAPGQMTGFATAASDL